jgi:hypothetical protein
MPRGRHSTLSDYGAIRLFFSNRSQRSRCIRFNLEEKDIMDLFGETLTFAAGFFLLLALALALCFEFVNGFHDTANAVATVIYTNTLKPVYDRGASPPGLGD